MNDFFLGMMYLPLGFRHLFAKGLKRFVVLPILFNFLLFSGLFYLIYHYLFPYAYEYLDRLPSWLHFLNIVFLVFFYISFFLLFLSMFTVFFNLIAAPFNGLLAEKAQMMLYKSTIPGLSFKEILWRTIKRQGQFLVYFLPRFVGICLLFFIPIIHPIYPILWFWFNAWMLSIQYQDFAMDNNLVGFKEMREMIKENRLLSLGFGLSINFASFIPLLNLFSMPAAVIGSVMLFCERNKPILSGNQLGTTRSQDLLS
ncbi:putative sulfate transport protein CysZ [Legionella birminghamensis]|uniref:Sulfate transport protein CysZ n=1 Tax=Legionella birminghamensis TaxID=28083 RepID=A0A378I6X9_9GAMM|nr:sulfate transporter CysZ [Legionella birminghamensis]KTC68356.1 putative sulfate transport protein CysZ [Legionella birminghamensis]STX30929.1 putative sulfate transport protein CysZ [Legionella birminghamensis]